VVLVMVLVMVVVVLLMHGLNKSHSSLEGGV
jgi:hypothetical protein